MEYMSREFFNQNRTEINTAVDILRGADPKRRKLFRLAAVYEKRTGEMLAEVLDTSFGPVVVYAAGAGTMSNSRGAGAGMRLFMRQHRRWRSITPLTGDADQVVPVMSRANNEYPVRGVDLIRTIEGNLPDVDDLNFARLAK